MKILHITSPMTWRGGEQQLMYLVEELASLGVNQVVMCPFNSSVHRYCMKHHVNCVTYFKGFSTNPMVAFRVGHICKREHVDLIHAHDAHAHNFAVLSAVLLKNPLPIIVSRRVDFSIHNGSMSMFKYNHPSVKRILCVSKTIRSVMAPFIKNPEVLEVVYSGIDLTKFEGIQPARILRSIYTIPEDHILIGNVAALAPHKDYPTFIRVAKRVLDAGLKATFFAIGEGPSRKEVEMLIAAEELQERVILTGFMDNIPSILKELDLFLVTSETEGLGTSILDAMASGVPVVGTKAGGIVELISHEHTGLISDVGDDEALAAAVLRMIDDHDLSRNCVENGKRLVENFTKQKTAKSTLEVYRSVLSDAIE